MSLFEFNNHLQHKMIVDSLAEAKGISHNEARKIISEMSFSEYHKLSEAGANITPPSGQTIAPAGPSQQKPPGVQGGPQQVKSVWPGKGAPVEVGMTVGLKGPNGLPVPGTVSQVDTGAKGVKVRNPATGQEEWSNMDTLEPFMAQGNQSTVQENFSNTYNVGDVVETPLGSGTITQVSPDVNISGKVMVKLSDPSRAGEDGKYKDTFMFTTDQLTRLQESIELQRLRKLAGISENCSAGATGAGAIAIAPAPMGKVKRRQETSEQAPVEYTPKEAPKTIVGDTKPNQASGKLSADLAARGKKTASRINNGRKR